MEQGAGRIPRVLIQVILVVLALRGAPACAGEAGDLPTDDVVTWRLTWDNDVVVHSDNQFSNGWSLQFHGSPSRTWDGAAGTPAFGKSMARWFLPVRRDGLLFREGWSIGQAIQTPDDQDREDVIVDDVPYAAALAVQNTWIAYDDRDLYGFGWLVGVVGPAALGRQVQTGFHAVTGNRKPKGWGNQLKNEPLLNLYYERKHKLAGSSYADLAVGVDGELGNLVTAAQGKVEARFGRHLPRGFLYVPDPIGRHLSYDAHLPPHEATKSTFYVSLSATAAFLGRSVFYEGNSFRDSHSIDHETFIKGAVLGLHYQRWRWGFHLSLVKTTDVIDPRIATGEPDTQDDYGSLMFEYRH